MERPAPRRVALSGAARTPIAGGPPESLAIRSGGVVLRPGERMAAHDSGSYEEVLVVLAGAGEFIVSDGPRPVPAPETAVYCPPDTRHELVNTGSAELRCVHVAARTR